MESGRFFILKTIKYGESDLIVKALSKQGSCQTFMAKGARKSKKRFGGGVLQPTHYVEFKYKVSKSSMGDESSMAFLEDALVINDFHKIRADYDRLSLGLYFVHLIEKVSLEGVLDSEYSFDLLGNTLQELESTNFIHLLKTQFELKFLHSQGVLPPGIDGEEFLSRPVSSHNQLASMFQKEDPRFLKIKSRLSTFINNYV